MKKVKILLFAIAMIFAGNTYAQDQGDMKAQVGVLYGLDVKSLGIDGTFMYFVSDDIAIAPGYTYYLEKNSVKYSSINLEARYYFQEGLYGLAGYDIIKTTVSILGTNVSASGSEIAIGGGYDLSMGDSMNINLQAKYAGQLVIGAGIVFGF